MSLRYTSRVFARALQGLLKKQSSSKEKMLAGIKPSPARPMSESGNVSQDRWVSGDGEPAKKVNEDEKRRLREAEKADRVMHLIVWGPRN